MPKKSDKLTFPRRFHDISTLQRSCSSIAATDQMSLFALRQFFLRPPEETLFL